MLDGLKSRLSFVWTAVKAGVPQVWRLAAVLTVIVGGSGLTAVAVLADAPALAGLGLLGALLLTLVEGTFRLHQRMGGFSGADNGPRLVAGSGITRARFFTTPAFDNKVVLDRWEAWMLVPIRNEGREEAKHLYARLRILEDVDLGPALSHWIEVGWVAEPRDEFLDPARHEPERDLAANGRDSYIATVHKTQGQEFCGLTTANGHWDIGLAYPFLIELEVRGSNVPATRYRYRVDPLDGETIDLEVRPEPL